MNNKDVKKMVNKLYAITCKFINKETISYLIFGVLTTLVDTITFFISNNVLKVEYVFATMVAWVLAVIFAYVTNKLWVFNSKNTKINVILKEAANFFIARILSLIFTIIWMIVTVEIIGVDEFLSKILANIFVVIINYLFSKLFIFKKA